VLPPARGLNPDLSTAVETLLAQATHATPDQRFQSVEEFRQALLGLAAQLAPDWDRSGSFLTPTATQRAVAPASVAALRSTLELPTQQEPRRAVLPRLILAVMVVVLLTAVGGLAIMRSHAAITPTPLPPSGDATVAALYTRSNIGLSAGAFIFDTSRGDTMLKRQGAQALAARDLHGALAAFRRALQSDPGDAEAAIYAANSQIALSGARTLTVVVGTAFGADTTSSEAVLRAALLAQQHFNTLGLLPGATRLRVLVANSGFAPSGAGSAMRLILSAANGANPQHIVGIVGWPDTTGTHTALAATTGLPYIVPGPAIGGLTSANYFALAPSDVQQGALLASAAPGVLGGHHIFILVDPNDARAAPFAQAFASEVQQLGTAGVMISRQEAIPAAQTGAFSQPALDAVASGSDVILVAGSDRDVASMAQALQQEAPGAIGKVRLLAPTWAYTPTLLGSGTDPTAQFVRNQTLAMASVVVASYAADGEWSALGVSTDQQPTFFQDYAAAFGSAGSAATPSGLDSTTVLAYDAVRLLVTAATRAAQGTRLPGPDGVLAALLAIRPGSAVQGVSGALAFDGSGAPVKKALALLALSPSSGSVAGNAALTSTVISIVGGVGAFCAGATCAGG
jgi:ABC-type branched-subunit amino acid transport system substrate-binding protein